MSDQRIYTKIDVLDAKIQKLKSIRSECEGIDAASKELSGGGESIMALKVLDEQYEEIKKELVRLIENSEKFFENVKNSMKSADQKAARKMNGSAE